MVRHAHTPPIATGQVRAPRSPLVRAGPRTAVVSMAAASESQTFAVGDIVQYSSSSNGWLETDVKAVSEAGTYDLGCKRAVPAKKIRRAGASLPADTASPTAAAAAVTAADSEAGADATVCMTIALRDGVGDREFSDFVLAEYLAGFSAAQVGQSV